MNGRYVKNKPSDSIWWWLDEDRTGEFVFSFDKKTNYNLFRDYPWKLTKKQKAQFDKENPFWADFFSDRNGNGKENGNSAD